MAHLTLTFTRERVCAIASYILMTAALLVVLTKSMLVALLTGLVTFVLINLTAALLKERVKKGWAKHAAVGLLATMLFTAIVITVWSLVDFFQSDAGSVQVLLQRLADIIEASRHKLPVWISQHLPSSVDELNASIASTLREHANKATVLGAHAEHFIMQVVFGMLVGILVAVADNGESKLKKVKPLVAALTERVTRFTKAFELILVAQAKISAVNTAIVALYLYIALPLCGVALPFKASIVLVTFFGGLLPVVGGVVANILIVVLALSHSLLAAIITEALMLALSKLELVLSARFIGEAISAKSWEPIVAMLFMYALFGMVGMVAAPFIYAYIKYELMKSDLV